MPWHCSEEPPREHKGLGSQSSGTQAVCRKFWCNWLCFRIIHNSQMVPVCSWIWEPLCSVWPLNLMWKHRVLLRENVRFNWAKKKKCTCSSWGALHCLLICMHVPRHRSTCSCGNMNPWFCLYTQVSLDLLVSSDYHHWPIRQKSFECAFVEAKFKGSFWINNIINNYL